MFSATSGVADTMDGQGLIGGQGVAGIEKTLKWKLFFFIGSLIVLITGIASVLYWMIHVQWAPAQFLTEVFLLFFGILMVFLDFPIPNPRPQEWPTLVTVRDHCYRFVLFMTRFMGRGMWYLFLSTMVFSALWDTNINGFFGGVFTLYLVVLGAIALFKGYMISNNLDKVRIKLLREIDTGGSLDHYIAPTQPGLNKVQFKALVKQVMQHNEEELFTDDDLDYVLNALNFLPTSNGVVSREEFEYWVKPGPMLIV